MISSVSQVSAAPAAEVSALLGKVSTDLQELLRCVVCQSRLLRCSDELRCANPACGTCFPIVDDVPVLINDKESLFRCAEFLRRINTTVDYARPWFREWCDQMLPSLSRNLKSRENYEELGRLLRQRASAPMVLVVGGRIPGQGMQALESQPGIRLVETDVAFGPRTRLICDAADLPFANSTFDGVIIQAVLQYVPDPARCVREIERVLKPDGLLYAETAFMQQVVHGRYDFTRFTYLGMRRLFRRFRELRGGPVGGPGMALAWAFHYFLLSFGSSRRVRAGLHAFTRLTVFWLKYFDPLLADRPGTYDAASGYFFLGERTMRPLPDRRLIELYRGAQ